MSDNNGDNLSQNEKSLKLLLTNLSNEDGIVRKSARELLTQIGEQAIGFLGELLQAPKHITRWEAVKTLSQIHNQLSIPYLINAMEDEDDDIRWLAAEGLISLGKESVEPLLKTLIENYPSIYLRMGVHHVLKILLDRGQFVDTGRLLDKIIKFEDESEIPVAANESLDAWRYKIRTSQMN